jgi:hypothetical protein
MWFKTLLDSLKTGSSRRTCRQARRRSTASRLAVEALEDRCVPAAMLNIGDVAVLEGHEGVRNAVVLVTVTEPHGNSITVNYRTADGTARAGSDYDSISGKLTFARNEMSKSILVPIRGDRLVEPNKAFVVRLSDAKGANLADGEGSVTIVDDEPRISINDVSALEGNTGTTPFTFTVSLSNAYDLPVTVNYATADDWANGRYSRAGGDYSAVSGTLTFAPGQMSQTITVLVNGYRLGEPYKTFSVKLSSPSSYAAISQDRVVGTILDDEPRISIQSSASLMEGDSGATPVTLTVSLSTVYDEPVTVDYAPRDSSAVAGWDYVAASGTLTFAPGQTSQIISDFGFRIADCGLD